MSVLAARLRFLALYYACWLPYGIIYGLTLLLQRPESGIADAVATGIWAVGWAGSLGLGVRWAIRRASARRMSKLHSALLFAAIAAAFAVSNTAGTVLGIWSGAPPDVLESFLKFAVWWDMISGLTLGALLIAIFIVLNAHERLREQRLIAQRSDELRIHAELQALRARLDPHFLFNTLHTITSLVRSDPPKAEEALERYGALMRYVLDTDRNQREEVTLEEELAFIRSYIELERLRLGDRMRVVEEIHEDALECRVLALTLQPLVENAIRHGIANRARGGTLRLAASVEGDRLEIVVGDDGAGGDPRQLASANGVGFRVVQQRLQARYGNAARIDVTSAPHEGWLVRLSMPATVTRANPKRTAAITHA
ncbi:MAG: histidine kinase [Gemmatimonadaceae bacterium]